MFDFSRTLTAGSLARYVTWKLAGKSAPVPLRVRGGARFWLRPDTTENNDFGVAYEVFVHDYYRLPTELDPSRIKRIVDIGGNVGMSVLHWLAAIPECQVTVFEPHPGHVAQLQRNLSLAGQSARVTVHPQAAGARARIERFSGLGSSTSQGASKGVAFEAEVVDALALLQGQRIDLLKIDIEGGEYELLGDPRFGTLDVGAIVMEWHGRGDHDADRVWCEDRLKSMGFRIQPIFREHDHGMFWALRQAA